MSATRCAPLFYPVKGRFRAPICATCRTAVGRVREFGTVSSRRSTDRLRRLRRYRCAMSAVPWNPSLGLQFSVRLAVGDVAETVSSRRGREGPEPLRC
jgi:hypothetical protein